MFSFKGWRTEDFESFVIEDAQEEEEQAEILARAWEEDAILSYASDLPLSDTSDATSNLLTKGVTRLGSVLSARSAQVLRCEIVRQLHEVQRVDGQKIADGQVDAPLSAVLSSVAQLEEDVCTRWDLRLRLTPAVRDAIREALSHPGLVGALTTVAGLDAELWECAALISAPGAAPQPLHSDTLWDDAGVLFSTFIAVQAITKSMGPTRFVIGSHTANAHQAFDDQGIQYISHISDSAALGLLQTGEATLYDGRILHCGGPNSSQEMRVMFYLTFRCATADGDELANEEAHSILSRYRGRFLLRDLVQQRPKDVSFGAISQQRP
eukprot:scaffold126678_cov31-Tisochrysis_lutea.AAC.4